MPEAPRISSSLVTPHWLADHLDAVVVLDATIERSVNEQGRSLFAPARAGFEAEHIPTARYADLFTVFSDPDGAFPFTAPAEAQFVAALQAHGIGPDSRVVAYDGLSGAWAARIWWVARSFGFDGVSVLDGGLAAWKRAGLAVESGAEAPAAPAEPFTPRRRPGAFLGKAEMLRLALGPQTGTPVLCALRTPEYLGDTETPRSGHIPHSLSVPYPDLLDGEGLLDHRRVEAWIDRLALREAERVVLYCGGAINASGLALALTEAGIGTVTIYDGSLNEWRADRSLPMAVGPAPAGGGDA